MDRFLGKRLDGRYEINEIIGIGGMAVVYKAYDRIEERVVSVKILKQEYVQNEEFKQRFQTESKAIAMLNHPNIVKIFDVSIGDNFQYIVMEYIDGITLKDYIKKQSVLSWKEALYFTMQILRALQHAHDKGIVHRDVKPQNIMLLRDGTIKVTDFGIARFSRKEKTITDKTIGSVHYISPEQARGDLTDEKADLYSVGVLLYEMLTGKLPFEAENAVSVAIMQMQDDPMPPRHLNSTIPVGLEQITMRAMMKNPNRRYHSDAEMLRDLEELKRDPDITFNYDHPYTDEPTRIIDREELDALTPPRQEDDQPEEKKKNMIPILAGIASVLVLTIALIFIFVFLRGCDTEEVACPNFFGMHYTEVLEEYPQYQYTFQLAKKDAKAVADKGCIVSQSIEAGNKIKEGANITLTYNDAEFVKVPDVTGYKDFETAKAALEKQGILVADEPVEMTPEEADQDKFKPGEVMGTDPEADTMVEKVITEEDLEEMEDESSTVTSSALTSSSSDASDETSSALAAAQAQVTLKTTQEGTPVSIIICTEDFPTLTGLTEEEAVEQIESFGLKAKVKLMYYGGDDYEEGEVFYQSIKAGESGTDISDETCEIYISVGPLTLTVTAPTDYPEKTYVVKVTAGSKSVSETFTSSTRNMDFTLVPTEASGTLTVTVDGVKYQEWAYEAGEEPHITNDYSDDLIVSQEPSSTPVSSQEPVSSAPASTAPVSSEEPASSDVPSEEAPAQSQTDGEPQSSEEVLG